jgi:hypothetical protein
MLFLIRNFKKERKKMDQCQADWSKLLPRTITPINRNTVGIPYGVMYPPVP